MKPELYDQVRQQYQLPERYYFTSFFDVLGPAGDTQEVTPGISIHHHQGRSKVHGTPGNKHHSLCLFLLYSALCEGISSTGLWGVPYKDLLIGGKSAYPFDERFIGDLVAANSLELVWAEGGDPSCIVITLEPTNRAGFFSAVS